MSNALQVMTNASSLNILGLTQGQAHLYRYIVKCSKEKTPVDMHQVALIFYTHVRKFENIYVGHDEKGYHYKKVNAMERFLQRVKDYPVDSYRYYDTKNWLKGNLGSFVMRGLLTAIPTFNPEEVVDVPTTEKT